MKHRLALPFLLVLVVCVGLARFAPAQRSGHPMAAHDLMAATLAPSPTLNAVLQALGATGDVIAGPGLVEGTGPAAALTLYSHGAAARDVVLTIVNTGSETIDITTGTGLPVFSVPAGHSRSGASNTAGLSSAYKWSCSTGGR